jgi:integrase
VALTEKRVDKLLRRGTPGKYSDKGSSDFVRGLYLVVASKTAAHYELRYQVNHVKRWMGLGSAFELTLKQARERAKQARLKLIDKIDPVAVRQNERAAAKTAAAKRLTFREAAEGYFETHQSQWTSAKHTALFLATLERWAYPHLGATDVAGITKDQILRLLEQRVDGSTFWNERTTTADRVRTRIKQILDWCNARGFRDGDNPADWQLLRHALPAPRKVSPIQNLPSMPYRDVPALMAELRKHEGVAVKALMFTILTAARVGEVIGATWDEIDFESATWTVPATRMKARRPHRVPLSPEAITLLRGLPTENDNPFLFIGRFEGRSISEIAQRQTLWRMGHKVAVHGFRSSFREWAAEQTRFPRELAELSLAHRVKSAAEAAYQRGDLLEKRRPLMAAWAKYVTAPPVVQAAKVVPIGAPR